LARDGKTSWLGENTEAEIMHVRETAKEGNQEPGINFKGIDLLTYVLQVVFTP
jgi:hypothetical protein